MRRKTVNEVMRDKERIKSSKFMLAEPAKRGRPKGVKNRPKEVIEKEKAEREILNQKKRLVREARESKEDIKAEPDPIPVGSIIVFTDEIRSSKAPRKFVVVDSMPYLIDYKGENGRVHSASTEYVKIVG